jgi:hypothetical protein
MPDLVILGQPIPAHSKEKPTLACDHIFGQTLSMVIELKARKIGDSFGRASSLAKKR